MSNSTSSTLPDWRRAGGLPAASAVLRVEAADFDVTELLDVEFSGDGEHDWLLLEKRNANTAWVARQLARYAGVAARDVGYAGLKDRHAVTRQWFSILRKREAVHDWAALELQDVRLLESRRHSRKLRRGAHRGNRFRLRLRELHGDPGPALERIAAEGVPNYFGEQRFGRDGGNFRLAERLFEGRRLKREQRGIALSAARSLLFNDLLDQRVRSLSWNQLEDGDIAILDGSNSHFLVDQVDPELAARCAGMDLHPSGPLWGRAGGKYALPQREMAIAENHPGLAAGLERHMDAARRSLRLAVANLSWEISADELQLSFDLPAGTFATAVLRECLQYRDVTRQASD